MSRMVRIGSTAALLVFAIGIAGLKADHRAATLAVTMTNDPTTNQIKVYDTGSRALLQTLSTRGKGGAGGNARGVKQYRGEIVAVVNNGSNTVAVFKREGNGLRVGQAASRRRARRSASTLRTTTCMLPGRRRSIRS